MATFSGRAVFVKENSVKTIDTKIDSEIKRLKGVDGNEPMHNKRKERMRDGIERLRDRRNRLTGNPKSEPMESVDLGESKLMDMIRGWSKQDIAAKVALLNNKDLQTIYGMAGEQSARRLLNPKDYATWEAARDRLRKEETEAEYLDLLDEALNVQQRRKRAMIARRNKAKLKIGRRKAQRRIASKDTIKNRARRQARSELVKKITRGKSKGELSYARRQDVEKKLERMKGLRS